MSGVRKVAFPELTDEMRRVHRAGQALHRDGASPAGALELLASIVEDRTWERVSDIHGRSFVGRFREFVEAKSPYGLGYDADQLPKLLTLRHPHEGVPGVAEQMARMRKQVRRLLIDEIPSAQPVGRPPSSNVRATNINGSDTGDYVVARLKRDAPEVADRVAAGQLTANAAARQMGWRKPRIVVSTPERTAAHLRKHLTPDELAELAQLLTTPDGDTP